MNLIAYTLDSGLFTYLGENGVKSATVYYLLYFLLAVVCMAVSYLLGSLNAGIIVSKLVYRDDVRKYGSGNAGTTNMLRTFGKKAALFTLLGDIAKTALAIVFTGIFFGFHYVGGVSTGDGLCYVAGLFAVLGHIFPVYYKFQGGKGVLATATMALILSPVPFLILLLIFIIIVAVTKYVSLGSVTVGVLYPVVLNAYFKLVFKLSLPGLCSLSVIVLAIIIVWCHRENLKRISERTERKISFKSKKKDEE